MIYMYKQTPVKTMGNGLATGCQIFYGKIYGFFSSAPPVICQGGYFCFGSLVILDVVCRYLSIYNIKIDKIDVKC